VAAIWQTGHKGHRRACTGCDAQLLHPNPQRTMHSLALSRAGRVLGDGAVLARLERLGRNSRIFPNLVRAGFPPEQLSDACEWYIRDARSSVERHAAQQLTQGYFDDEPLLTVLCRYFGCTDWKLESSPWFLGPEDFNRFDQALLSPVEFVTAQLEAGQGEARWDSFFVRLPFDLGMEQARRALWSDITQREHYWRAEADYRQMRASAMFAYLVRSLDIVHFTPDHYHYHWEQAFRAKFFGALGRFQQALEVAVRRWQEQRRERAERFSRGTFVGGRVVLLDLELLRALAYLGLSLTTVDEKSLRAAFRQRSKDCHPDLGGDPRIFQELSLHKDVVENWLRLRSAN
jgi:hypothetical protein